ncbi:peptidase MA family metallohydrolase [Marinagarivorans cellulosilyticus]|uniref:Peptidase MA-like domain-containing protein n=1 Tax=Marinagarivorans cellulosilyticus TaxID=2721545 RepID=A0AAN1WL85_9GAMM|nr:hypothetical protein [Marinagarivorans cellulosilyticus]BCD99655.1 hypothetical protein MARGE09_P3857 [Marinagarivorans cellulosilyticus]
MKYKKYLMWAGLILTMCLVGLVTTQPLLIKAIYAKYKSTDQFLTFEGDARIKYEQGAEQYAVTLNNSLDESQKAVEVALGAKFKKPISIYICSSQDVFNEYVYLSKNVRGAVYWGKLFLSPGAFNRGSLAKLTKHELTHYLFYTHLGERAHIEGIPLWFREGIAEFVANGGPKFTQGRSIQRFLSVKERESYLSGSLDFWFTTEDPSDAVSNGTVNWVLYKVGALLVHYLHDLSPQQFEELIKKLLAGQRFEKAVYSEYGRDIQTLRSEFTKYIQNAH